MMQPPSEFDNLVSAAETLKILLIAVLSAIAALFLVITIQLHRVGNKFSQLVSLILAPPVVVAARQGLDKPQQKAAGPVSGQEGAK